MLHFCLITPVVLQSYYPGPEKYTLKICFLFPEVSQHQLPSSLRISQQLPYNFLLWIQEKSSYSPRKLAWQWKIPHFLSEMMGDTSSFMVVSYQIPSTPTSKGSAAVTKCPSNTAGKWSAPRGWLPDSKPPGKMVLNLTYWKALKIYNWILQMCNCLPGLVGFWGWILAETLHSRGRSRYIYIYYIYNI